MWFQNWNGTLVAYDLIYWFDFLVFLHLLWFRLHFNFKILRYCQSIHYVFTPDISTLSLQWQLQNYEDVSTHRSVWYTSNYLPAPQIFLPAPQHGLTSWVNWSSIYCHSISYEYYQDDCGFRSELVAQSVRKF